MCATHPDDASRPMSSMRRAARAAWTRLLDFLHWMLGLVVTEGLTGVEGIRRTLYGTGTMTAETSTLRDMTGFKGHTGMGMVNELSRLRVLTIKGPVIGLGGAAIAVRGDQCLNLQGARAAMLGETMRSGGVYILRR